MKAPRPPRWHDRSQRPRAPRVPSYVKAWRENPAAHQDSYRTFTIEHQIGAVKLLLKYADLKHIEVMLLRRLSKEASNRYSKELEGEIRRLSEIVNLEIIYDPNIKDGYARYFVRSRNKFAPEEVRYGISGRRRIRRGSAEQREVAERSQDVAKSTHMEELKRGVFRGTTDRLFRTLSEPEAHGDEDVAGGLEDVAELPHMDEPNKGDLRRIVAQLFPNMSAGQQVAYVEEGFKRDEAARRANSYEARSAAQPREPIPYSERPPSMKLVEFLRREYLAKGVLARKGFNRLAIKAIDESLYQAIKDYCRSADLPDDVNIPKARERRGRREKVGNPTLSPKVARD